MNDFNIIPTGRARLETIVVDNSQLQPKDTIGTVCIQGVTTMGKPYTPTFIKTWDEFLLNFGGLIDVDDSLFPTYVKRMLGYGARLCVSRVAHPDGSGGWQGNKATGTITQSSNSIEFEAKEVGPGYNEVKITIQSAKSGDTSKVDVIETYGKSVVVIKDITKTSPTVPDGIRLNNALKYTKVDVFPTTMPLGAVTLSNGSQTISSIVDSDYVGLQANKTGWYAFDTVFYAMRIANIDRPSSTVDAALAQYCLSREDMRFYIGPNTSENADFVDMLGWRSAQSIDTWRGDGIVGNIEIADETYPSGKLIISALPDVLGLMSKKDYTYGAAFSAAGDTSGVLKNLLDVPYNLDEPSVAMKEAFDRVYDNQMNPVIKTGLPDIDGQVVLKTVYWGNRTLQKDQNKLLRYSHVADLVILMQNTLAPKIKAQVFKPNQPSYWYHVYGLAKKKITEWVRIGYINGAENTGWIWKGDQFKTSLNNLEINTIEGIQQGIYLSTFDFKPFNLMEYIGLALRVTDNSVTFSLA